MSSLTNWKYSQLARALEEYRKEIETDAYKRGSLDGQAKMQGIISAAEFERGVAEGERRANNANGTNRLLAQIAGMARQIEESHDALRRRNSDISRLTKRIAELEAEVLKVKQQNEGEARAEAWHEGWKHDSDYAFNYGQRCPSADCNPYRKGENK